MNAELLIGIDGGATHSTAIAALSDGRIVARAHGEGLNFNNVGVETVRLRLERLVSELCEKAALPVGCVCVGSAALDAHADAETTIRFTGLLRPEQLMLTSDAYIALMGLTRGEPGMIAICGTGSMLMLADQNGAQHISGGWGYMLEDAGSGYAIAREGLIAAVDHYEGTGEFTALTECVREHFDTADIRDVIPMLYAPDFTPDRLAAFARHVLEKAASGDSVSDSIIARSMGRLAAQAAQLFKKAPGVTRAGLYGGIFQNSALAREAFTSALLKRMPGAVICRPEYPPEAGAVIHIMKTKGIMNENTLMNLKNTM